MCVVDSPPSFQTQAGWPCLQALSVTLCYSFALRSRAAGARHWLLQEVDESGMAPQGPWVARGEAALMCQSLSPEVPEPRGVRHFLARQSFGAVGSSCHISLSLLRPALNMARLCIWLLSETQQENWSLYISMNILTHACGRAGAATYLTQPVLGKMPL